MQCWISSTIILRSTNNKKQLCRGHNRFPMTAYQEPNSQWILPTASQQSSLTASLPFGKEIVRINLFSHNRSSLLDRPVKSKLLTLLSGNSGLEWQLLTSEIEQISPGTKIASALMPTVHYSRMAINKIAILGLKLGILC